MSLDPYWQAVRDLLDQEHFRPLRTLVPAADWGLTGSKLEFYTNHDRIDISEAEVVVLHKGMIGGLPVAMCETLLTRWTAVFANEVHAVFARTTAYVSTFDRGHLGPLEVYANPRRFWRHEPRQAAYLHIPKTAGTSIWTSLAQHSQATILFSSDAALQAYDGDINAYEFVYGHFHYGTLRAKGWTGPVFTTLRNPIDRLLSFVRHTERERAEIATLDITFQAMLSLIDKGDTSADIAIIGTIINAQTLALGADPAEDIRDPQVQARAFCRAVTRIESGEIEFAFVEDPPGMIERVKRIFGVELADLPRLNTTSADHDGSRFLAIMTELMSRGEISTNDFGLVATARHLRDNGLA